MTEASEEMKALARRCAAKYWQTGEPSDEAAARSILSGEWDDHAYTQAALAAIQATTERAAKLADGWNAKRRDRATETSIAAALRDGAHLKEQSA